MNDCKCGSFCGQPGNQPDVKPTHEPKQMLEQKIESFINENSVLREKLIVAREEISKLKEELNREKTRTSQAIDQAYAVGHENGRMEKCYGCNRDSE